MKRVSLIAAAVGVAGYAVPGLADGGPSVNIQGFPKNGTKVLSKVCQDGASPWDSDCEWSMTFVATVNDSDKIQEVKGFVDNVEQVVTNNPAPGCGGNGPTVVESSFDHLFAVSCPTQNQINPAEDDFTIKFRAKDCRATPNPGQDSKTLTLKCYFCDATTKTSHTDSNGATLVEPEAFKQLTDVQFVVLNNDQVSNTVNLLLTATQGWSMDSVPGSVVLGPGESVEFLLGVGVPGGLPVGTSNTITLEAELAGVPSSQSSADAVIVVLSPGAVPTVTQWGMIVLTVVVLGVGGVVFGRRRAVA